MVQLKIKTVTTVGHAGFTLVELLVALVISGVLMTAVYTTFQAQQNSYLAQEQVAEMQQNIRAGMDIMVSDLKMAGFRGSGSSSAGIQDAKGDAITFSYDLNEDGDTDDAGENIGYDIYTSPTTGPFTLERASSGSALTLVETPANSGHYEISPHQQPFAENIERLEFYYKLADGARTTAPAAAQLELIRSIEVSILAITRNPDRNYTNNKAYRSLSGADWTPAPPDHFRRRLQTMTVKCRNLGL